MMPPNTISPHSPVAASQLTPNAASPTAQTFSSHTTSSESQTEFDELLKYGHIDNLINSLHNNNPHHKLDLFITPLNNADFYGVHELACLTSDFLISQIKMIAGNASFLLNAAKKVV